MKIFYFLKIFAQIQQDLSSQVFKDFKRMITVKTSKECVKIHLFTYIKIYKFK